MYAWLRPYKKHNANKLHDGSFDGQIRDAPVKQGILPTVHHIKDLQV